VSASTTSVAVMPGWRPAGQLDADDDGQAHPRGAAQHHVLGFEAAHADRDHAQRIDVRRVAVGAHQVSGKATPSCA
jgi:hypothetical protein